MLDWPSNYVGLPFAEHGRTREGVDCWGLVRLAMFELRGLELPDYGRGYSSTEDRLAVPDAIASGLCEGWQKIAKPTPGALIVFNVFGVPMHCALAIPDRRFLHSRKGIGVATERLDSPMWARRIEGFYHHE